MGGEGREGGARPVCLLVLTMLATGLEGREREGKRRWRERKARGGKEKGGEKE